MRYIGYLAAISLCVVIGGCGGKKPPNAAGMPAGGPDQPTMAQSDSSDSSDNDPCSLLEPGEVAAVFGGSLGTPPYRASNDDPSAKGSDCIYRGPQFQEITLSVEFEGGQQAYHIGDFVGNLVKGTNVLNDKTKQAMVSEDGSEIAGEWDEAKLTPFNCCIFNALRADQMITIDFTGSAATLKQAAALVDAAFKRIPKPLTLDGGANVAAARKFLDGRPKRRDPCSILTQAEVEAILGKLIAAPVGTADSCSYERPPQGIRQIYELRYGWANGNYNLRSKLTASRMGGAAAGGIMLQSTTQQQVANAPSGAPGAKDTSGAGFHTEERTTSITVDEAARQMTGQTFTQGAHLTGEEDAAGGGPWERSATIGPKFEAIRKDVSVEIDLRGVNADQARALVAAAISKI